tara:strand:+ start:607 stop:792 length:186 start_codon:yes stop_codon:yes gene_type:complete
MAQEDKRVIGLSKSILKKYYEAKKDMEKSLPVSIGLKDSQFIEGLINFYLENRKRSYGTRR